MTYRHKEIAMGILTINSREARIKWRDLLDKVYAGSSDVVIERNGKPVAVLIPVEDYEELQDELDDLRSARRVAVVYETWKQNPPAGRAWEEVKTDLINRGLLDE
jgi:prevent-host-death family protein